MPSTFSLPLTPFEQYMLADDTHRQPMTFLMRWRFQGRAERKPLEAAFLAAVAANPFFTARIERHGRAEKWVDGTESPMLDWDEAGTPLSSPRGHNIDLHREPGARFWVRVGPDATELTVLVHHAVTDGIGCLRFFSDWMCAYDKLLAGEAATLSQPTPSDLLLRDVLDLAPPVPVTRKMRLQGLVAVLTETFKFNCLRPADLRESLRAKPAQSVSPLSAETQQIDELVTLSLTADESAAVRRAASAQNVTLNDLLLRDAYLALAAWQAAHAPRAKQRLRLTVPISMRDRKHKKLPACNVLSYVSLTRSIADTQAPDALLQGLHEEMKLIRYWRIGGWFLGMIRFAHRLRILKPALRMPVCYSTMVLSNLGKVTTIVGNRLPRQGDKYVAGNLVLEEVTAAPPTRYRTPLSAAVFYYNQRLTISLRVDERVLSRSAAQEWLDLYRRQLLVSAADASQTQFVTEPNGAKEHATLFGAEHIL